MMTMNDHDNVDDGNENDKNNDHLNGHHDNNDNGGHDNESMPTIMILINSSSTYRHVHNARTGVCR